MKKIVSVLLACMVLFLAPLPALAEESEDLSETVLAPNFILVDASDPTIVFYAHNADERSIPGSTMKIMTCILALENCPDLEERVVITPKAASLKETNSLMEVLSGEDLSIRELLYGLMLESGNDAALTLALRVAGTTEDFAAMMNDKAAQLGMTQTNFINPSGAYKRDQYSTPRDMAILACYAMENELFRQIVSTPYYTVEQNSVRRKPMKMVNGNRLILPEEDNAVYYPEAVGVKTGSTENGGKCLVSAATRNGRTVICVMLGAKEGGSKNARMNRVFQDSARLMQKALDEEYVQVTPEDLGLSYETDLQLDGGSVHGEALFSGESLFLPRQEADALRENAASITVEETIDPSLSSPAEEDTLGAVTFSYQGAPLFTADLVATQVLAAPSPTPVENAPTPVPASTDSPEAVVTADRNRLWMLLLLAGIVLLGAGTLTAVLLQRKRKKRRKRGRKRS